MLAGSTSRAHWLAIPYGIILQAFHYIELLLAAFDDCRCCIDDSGFLTYDFLIDELSHFSASPPSRFSRRFRGLLFRLLRGC